MKQLIWKAFIRDWKLCSYCCYNQCISNRCPCYYCYKYDQFEFDEYHYSVIDKDKIIKMVNKKK